MDNLPANLVSYLLKALLGAGHFEKALESSNRCFSCDGNQVEEMIFRVAAMKMSKSLSRKERLHLKKYLYDRLDEAQKIGVMTQIGIAHYNIANHLRSVGELSWAIFHYKRAAHNSADYLRKKYFHIELGGVLFLGGRYKLAVKFYEKALNLEPDIRTKALLADSLMFAGEYEKSLIIFDEILNEQIEHDAEWHLKSFVLTHLVKKMGIVSQKRLKKHASSLVVTGDSAPHDERLLSYEAAFSSDALCALAWFNYGASHSAMKLELESDIWMNAYAGYLIAGLIQTNDIEAWCNAILCALNLKSLWGQIPLVSQYAYFCMGDEFLNNINKEIIDRMGVCDEL